MNIKEKTLFITSRSDIGGGPKYLLNDLISKNRDCCYVAAPKGEYFNQYKQNTTQIIEIPFRKFSILTYFKLLVFLRNHDIWTIHSHGFGAGIYSRLLALWGYRIIHTYHGIHLPRNSKEKIKITIEKVLSYLTDTAINVAKHEQSKARHLRFMPSSEIVITTKINKNKIAQIKQQFSKQELRSIFSMPQDRFIIGALTRLDPIKNISELIRRFQEFAPSKNPMLYIAGDGEQRTELEALCQQEKLQNQVVFLGDINNPIHFLLAIDQFASLSKSEGMPLAVLEAIECKVHCTLSDIEAHREIYSKYKPKNLILKNVLSYEI